MTTATDWLGLSNLTGRAGTVAYQLLDADGNVEGELHPSKTPDTPKLTNDGTRAIKRNISGLVFPRTEYTDVNIPAARIRPQWHIDGDPNSPYPLGVFLFGDASYLDTDGTQELHADLDDLNVIIDQPIRRTFTRPQGAPVTAAMQALVDLYPVTFDIVAGAATLPQAIFYGADTLGSTILNDLCAAAGYLPAYFDNNGTGRLRPAQPIDTLTPDHLYGPGTIIIAGTNLTSDQILSSPNVFDVTGNGGADNNIFGEYVLPSSAPNSIANRGFAIVQPSSLASVTDSAQARAAAQAAGTNPDSGFRQWQFTTTPNPTHDTFDLIGRTDTLEVYREQSWSLDLVEGANMEHDTTRLDGATFDG